MIMRKQTARFHAFILKTNININTNMSKISHSDSTNNFNMCEYIIYSTGYEERLFDFEDDTDHFIDLSSKQREQWGKIKQSYQPIYIGGKYTKSRKIDPIADHVLQKVNVDKLISYVIFKKVKDDGRFFEIHKLLRDLSYCEIYDLDDILLIDNGKIVLIKTCSESG